MAARRLLSFEFGGVSTKRPEESNSLLYDRNDVAAAAQNPATAALDLIFGPAMYRMAIGHAGLTPADADAIVATAMRALAS
jgi:hypothetical protein